MTQYAGADALSAIAAKAKAADLKTVSAVGRTLTFTFGDGSSQTVETQDTNTLYSAGTGISISNENVISTSGTVLHYMGSCAVAELPTTASAGDVWNITDESSYGPAGTNVAFNGTTWDSMGGVVEIPIEAILGTSPVVASLSGTTVTIGINAATTSAAGSMSASDKSKLDGIAAGAQVNAIATITGTAPITASKSGTTETIGISPATTSAAGSLSATDKAKLDGIAAGAQVNTINSIVGTAPVTASLASGVETIGISSASSSSAGTMSSADYTKLSGIEAGAQVNVITSIAGTAPISASLAAGKETISISPANTSSPGSMSAADKTKLDGIATGANNYTLPTASTTVLGGVKVDGSTIQITNGVISGAAQGITGISSTSPIVGSGTSGSITMSHAESGVTAGSYGPSANAAPAFGATFTVPYETVDSTGHVTAASNKTITIPSADASTSAHGLMTAAMVTKLNGIATGATADSAMTAATAESLWTNA